MQIGDPFAEKLLIEASLELIERGLLEGLQDLGGAGITCAVSESAARAGMGVRLDLDAVPLREPDMEAFEILTSESQERMLAIVPPSKLDDVRAVCERWGLDIAVIADLVEGGKLTVTHGGVTVAEVPAVSLVDEGPEYDRPREPPAGHHARAAVSTDDPTFAPFEGDLREALLRMLGAPNVASKRWAWQQYDSRVQGQTVAGPGSDAAIVRVPGSLKALALSTDGKGRYGALDPYLGAVHAVAEAARNVAVSGAQTPRDHELPQLRQPRAPGRHVAVRRVDQGDTRCLHGARDAGHRRQRQLLQRVGRLVDLADTGDRHAGFARGPPAPRSGRVPAVGPRRLRAR